MRRLPALCGALAVTCAVAVAGCGSVRRTALPLGNRIRGDRLTIYVAVPMNDQSSVSGAAIVGGARLALRRIHGRIGRYRVALKPVDDAGPGFASWNAPAAGQAAQTAVADPTTIGYIGDFNSGASAVSIPILNRLAIAQISPTSTAVGLTSAGIGASPGEPQAYYPTPLRTFARVVPSDLIQAEVQVKLQQRLGCQSTYVLDDGEYDGEAVSQAFDAVAQERGLQVVATKSYVPTATSYLSLGQAVAQSGADCVLVAAIPDRNAAQLTAQVAAQVPHDRLFGTMGLAESTFTNPADGGIPAAVGRRMLITAAIGRPAVARRLGLSGEPVAIDGYAATELMLTAIREATDGGREQAQRVKVVEALFSGRLRDSVLGPYRIKRSGDTTLDAYGVYRVLRGSLQYWRSITG